MGILHASVNASSLEFYDNQPEFVWNLWCSLSKETREELDYFGLSEESNLSDILAHASRRISSAGRMELFNKFNSLMANEGLTWDTSQEYLMHG